jgi:hypothetical protein
MPGLYQIERQPAPRRSHMSAHSGPGRSVAVTGFGPGMVMVPPVWPGLAVGSTFTLAHTQAKDL